MKYFILPEPLPCPPQLEPSGKLEVSAFIRQLVLTRPAWRERGKAPLLLEVSAAFEGAKPGDEIGLSSEAYELTAAETAMRDVQVNWMLAPLIAQIQNVLYSATDEPTQRERERESKKPKAELETNGGRHKSAG